MTNKKLLNWIGFIVIYLFSFSVNCYGSNGPLTKTFLDPIVKNITYDGNVLTVYYAFNYSFMPHQSNGGKFPYNFIYRTKSSGSVPVKWVFEPTVPQIEINTPNIPSPGDNTFSVNVAHGQSIITIATAGLEVIFYPPPPPPPTPPVIIGICVVEIDPGSSPVSNYNDLSFIITPEMLKEYDITIPKKIAHHELDETGIHTFPNPVGDQLNIETLEPSNVLLGIADVFGEVFYRKQYARLKPTESIDVQHLSPGMYILTVRTESGILQKKFLKM